MILPLLQTHDSIPIDFVGIKFVLCTYPTAAIRPVARTSYIHTSTPKKSITVPTSLRAVKPQIDLIYFIIFKARWHPNAYQRPIYSIG